jgi:hypothetical protein
LGDGGLPPIDDTERSKAYADQNDRDYQALNAAVSSGRIDPQTGL